jgi:hypothetical protein
MPRRPLFGQAMTGSERKRRWREAHRPKFDRDLDQRSLDDLRAWGAIEYASPRQQAVIGSSRSAVMPFNKG